MSGEVELLALYRALVDRCCHDYIDEAVLTILYGSLQCLECRGTGLGCACSELNVYLVAVAVDDVQLAVLCLLGLLNSVVLYIHLQRLAVVCGHFG